MSELKPCPFCGGNQQEVREVGDCGELFSVMCGCGGESDFHQRDWGAINQWNKRPLEEALTEINRLQSEENKQLAEDNAKLTGKIADMTPVVSQANQWRDEHEKVSKLLTKANEDNAKLREALKKINKLRLTTVTIRKISGDALESMK